MSKRLFVLIIILISSCRTYINNDVAIKGNWKATSNKTMFSEYIEVYYSDSEIYFWTTFGLSTNKYKIEGREYFLFDSATNQFDNKGRLKKYDKNRLTILTNDKEVTFSRLDDSNTLEDYVIGKISEEEYLKAFEKRLMEW